MNAAEEILYRQLDLIRLEYERAAMPILEKLYQMKSVSTPKPMFMTYEQAEKFFAPLDLTQPTEEE